MTDAYCCPECAFLFAGYNRSPPYPHCPDCGHSMLRELKHGEVDLASAGFIPARIN